VLILVLITLLTRGIMFISFPLAPADDNSFAQKYLIDRLVEGDFLVGNVRYNSGYPLVIAPVFFVAQAFGALQEHVVLLVQIGLSSLIPFMVYDILRHLASPREGFIVALVFMLDPFGLQWAHQILPVWMIAFAVVLSLWLAYRTIRTRQLRWTFAAGLSMGIATMSRYEFALVAAVLGTSFLFLHALPLRFRLQMLALLGTTSAAIFVLYMALIQYPGTGRWSLSCISAMNALEVTLEMGIPLRAEHGPASQRMAELLSLPPVNDLASINTADGYRLWRIPGPWASEEDRAAFLAQTASDADPTIAIVTPMTLIYYLGPCEVDSIQRALYWEAVRTAPERILLNILPATLQRLMQTTFVPPLLDPTALPEWNELSYSSVGFGFARATGSYLTGQVVWEPGIRLYDFAYEPLSVLRWVAPFALVWAFVWGSSWYRTVAMMLFAPLVLLAIIDNLEYRISAPLYPLINILIGGLIAAGWARISKPRQR
jgi:hypothetical protein